MPLDCLMFLLHYHCNATEDTGDPLNLVTDAGDEVAGGFLQYQNQLVFYVCLELP